jgi:rhodanese-related sulfurtransferase
VTAPLRTLPPGVVGWSPRQVAALRNRFRVIDVREPAEFRGELGHVPGSELVPVGQVEAAAVSWDRTEPIVLVCRSGARSARVAKILSGMGFSVIDMQGGMIAYCEAGLPVER